MNMHVLENIYSLNKISFQLILLAHLLELYKSDCWFNILLGGVTIFLSSHYVQVQNLHGHFPRFRMFRIQINKITRAVTIMQMGNVQYIWRQRVYFEFKNSVERLRKLNDSWANKTSLPKAYLPQSQTSFVECTIDVIYLNITKV